MTRSSLLTPYAHAPYLTGAPPMAFANRTAPLTIVGIVCAGAALRCAPLIGLDDLQQVSCIDLCDEGAGGGSGQGGSGTTGATSGSSTTGSTTAASGSSTSAASSTTTSGAGATTSSSGAGGAAGGSGTGGSGGTGSPDAGRDSGSAGGPGAAGSAGAGGGDAGSSLREELVDSLDDNRLPHLILPARGRNGYWFTVNDGTPGGTQSPTADSFMMTSGGVNGSPYAAHLSGRGFTNWGIYMGFTLNKSPQGVKYTYDARAYRGITFWAKLGSTDMCSPASDCHILRLNVSTRDTDPKGNVCTFCSDHFGTWLTLTPSWQKYTVLFSELAQEGWGVPGPGEGLRFDASRTYEVQFEVQPAGKPFDYWVDEVSFVLP